MVIESCHAFFLAFVRTDLSLFVFVFLLPQLDESKDFEERKLIRAAMRDLRKKKRGISTTKAVALSDAVICNSVLLHSFSYFQIFEVDILYFLFIFLQYYPWNVSLYKLKQNCSLLIISIPQKPCWDVLKRKWVGQVGVH